MLILAKRQGNRSPLSFSFFLKKKLKKNQEGGIMHNKHYEKWLDEYLHKKNVEKMNQNLKNKNSPNPSKEEQRNNHLKKLIIKVCRNYLNQNNIPYREEQSETSFSYYFHINKSIMEWQHPVIRISDHLSNSGKYRLAEFITSDIGKHTNDQRVRNMVIRKLDKGFKNQRKSALHKIFENLDK